MTTSTKLRDEFDRAFAAPRMKPESLESFLILRIEGDRYAVSLRDVATVHADRRVVALPSPRAALLGLASFRGTLTPVYDLRRLLGHPAQSDPNEHSQQRWLLVLRTREAVGVSFDALEAHVRVAADRVASLGDERLHERTAKSAAHVRGTLRLDDGALVPLIDMGSVLAAIASPKE